MQLRTSLTCTPWLSPVRSFYLPLHTSEYCKAHERLLMYWMMFIKHASLSLGQLFPVLGGSDILGLQLSKVLGIVVQEHLSGLQIWQYCTALGQKSSVVIYVCEMGTAMAVI